MRLDANTLAFFERELTHVKAKTYDVKYPTLKFAEGQIIPINSDVGPGKENINYKQYDEVGIAKIVRSYANKLPRADVKGKEFTARVYTMALEYAYSIDEIEAAQVSGVPLDQKKANATRKGTMQLIENLAFSGDDEYNIPGFNTNPNMTETVIPADGTGSSKTFASKTPEQILRDLNDVANTPFDVTRGIEYADTLLLPNEQYSHIASTPRTTTSDTTILNYFLENNPWIKHVEPVHQMKGAGAGGTDRMISYRKDPDCLTLEIPVPYEQLEVQKQGLEFVVPTRARIGGVLFYYPLSMSYADGI